jgi:beta-glucosidase
MTDPSPTTTTSSPAEISPIDAQRLAWARSVTEQLGRDEKICFLHQYSPGVQRLGIGPFVTGTEGVHGVAWKGPTTQFPQPSGMAASWDPALLHDAARVIATEVRELHAQDPSVSLNVWAPVVNTLRHPLWGRTEEAYTEDPLLNSVLGTAFSEGLRGPGDTWTVVPTLKHFLAYSNETDRAATSSQLSRRVLEEYELPGFAGPVAAQAAGAVMLSYNLVNGRPAHLTDLLDSRLRALLPDPDLLFVVSDAGAPGNLFRSQKVVPDASHAYAAMLRAGVDSFTDNDSRPDESVQAVRDALEAGLIDDSHVERAVVRQLVARARTGEFDALIPAAKATAPARSDAPAAVPSGAAATTSPVEVPAPASRAGRRTLSREIATRSAVLLAHRDTEALPLPQGGPIAVIGEGAHSVLHDWYSGDLHDPVPLATALNDATTAVRSTRGLARIRLAVRSTGAAPGVPTTQLVTGSDTHVVLGADRSLHLPRPGCDAPPATDPYSPAFEVLDLGEDTIALRDTIDGSFVAPDDRGQLVADADRIGGWVVQETFRRSVDDDGSWTLQHVGSGRFVGIEHHTGALVLRSADPASAAILEPELLTTPEQEFTRITDGARTVVLVVGNEPHVHGRETEDRPHVRLSGPDRDAAERLAQLPGDVHTVLVVKSSYPYDLEGLEERVGAVLWSSHAGEAEGEALADLLTGERDFSGRLAQTWPDSSPLPALLDYDVIGTGSTYLYGQGARFRFGHGLSLDESTWRDVRIEAGDDGIRVRLHVDPPSERRTRGPLHDVVQIYVDAGQDSFPRRPYRVPDTRLIGAEALEIGPEGTDVDLLLPYDRLALWATDRDGWELPTGPLTVRAARSSALTIGSAQLTVPDVAIERAPLPAATTGTSTVPASSAESVQDLQFCAATLLEGTELRCTATTPGTAEFVLEAGIKITGITTRSLPSPGAPPAAGSAVLIDAETQDAADVLCLPHTVVPEPGRSTGRIKVRLDGAIALTALEIERS